MSEEEKKVVSLANARGKEKDKHKDEDVVSEGTYTPEQPVYCSFCGRPNTQVMKMIQGPGVNICSECTMIAVQYFILEDRIPSEEAKKVLAALWRASDN